MDGAVDQASEQKSLRSSSVLLLTLVLALLVVLGLTVVPSTFTLDEDNYLVSVLALRKGGFVLNETAGLTPSFELYAFDPWPAVRAAPTTPVGSVVPPLYAALAVPFSWFGWRGLVAMNLLAFGATIVIVYRLAQDHATKSRTAWIAALTFALGSYSIEYAQGLWPQCLSMALCLGAFYAASRVRAGARTWVAALGGLLAGLAAGVRYQNVVFAVLVGLGLALLTARRARAVLAFGAGLATPLTALSLVNHARFGSWNPVSKGPAYSTLGAVATDARFVEPLRVLAAKVVDYALHPVIDVWEPNPASGAYIAFGAVKKAWLQSCPWIAVALVALGVGLVRLAQATTRAEPRSERDRELGAVAIVMFGVLAFFASQGFGRTDGVGFNQRYFLELVPLAAIVLAWTTEAAGESPLKIMGYGAAASALIAVAITMGPDESTFRQLALLRVPLALAIALVAAWVGTRWIGPKAWSALLGATLAWACVVHLTDDVRVSRALREYNAMRQHMLESVLPERSALIAPGHFKDAAAPLRFDHDLVVVDPAIDGGHDTPRIVSELLAQKRRVFVDVSELSPATFERYRGNHAARATRPGAPVFEIVAPAD